MRRIPALAVLMVVLLLTGLSCTYSLRLGGAIIPANMKTIKVDYFENDAQLVVANLSTQFTEALKSDIRNNSRLAIVTGDADAEMSGSITDYNISPVSINATSNNALPIANASQLTITVQVKYTNKVNPKDNFDQTFSKSENFTGDINTQEQKLIADINKQLTEDIFNKAFANW